MQAHASPNRKSTRSAPGEALTLMWPVLSNWRWEHGGKGACQSVWCILWRDSFKQAPKVSGFNSWWIFGARRHLVSVHESQQNRNGALSSASPPSLHFTSPTVAALQPAWIRLFPLTWLRGGPHDGRCCTWAKEVHPGAQQARNRRGAEAERVRGRQDVRADGEEQPQHQLQSSLTLKGIVLKSRSDENRVSTSSGGTFLKFKVKITFLSIYLSKSLWIGNRRKHAIGKRL